MRFKSTDNSSSSDAPVVLVKSKDIKKSKDKPWLLDLGIPSLAKEWRNMFSASTLFSDVSAGVTVGWYVAWFAFLLYGGRL
jgi:hypothetical protein